MKVKKIPVCDNCGEEGGHGCPMCGNWPRIWEVEENESSSQNEI